MNKKLKDGAYYWVQRKPTEGEEGRYEYHHWEPMLWGDGRFWQRGYPDHHISVLLGELTVGEIIERKPKRTSRKGFIATTIDRKKRRADPIYDVIYPSAKAAAKAGTGLPVAVEVSWANADFNFANGFARSCTTPTK